MRIALRRPRREAPTRRTSLAIQSPPPGPAGFGLPSAGRAQAKGVGMAGRQSPGARELPASRLGRPLIRIRVADLEGVLRPIPTAARTSRRAAARGCPQGLFDADVGGESWQTGGDGGGVQVVQPHDVRHFEDVSAGRHRAGCWPPPPVVMAWGTIRAAMSMPTRGSIRIQPVTALTMAALSAPMTSASRIVTVIPKAIASLARWAPLGRGGGQWFMLTPARGRVG